MYDIEECIPDPHRVIEGLRDTGYEFRTAVADIVDNSIAANASEVNIFIRMNLAGVLRVTIVDNGTGMDRAGLVNAMRYGSQIRESRASLGKFGLGLKTASTAFCRRLAVTSRASGTAPFVTATWDLDEVAKAGKWNLVFSAPDPETVKELSCLSQESSGTIVVWEKVDRLLKSYKKESGTAARSALDRRLDELKFHLRMVFQRYLDTCDTRAPNVTMSVNGKPLEPWNPFFPELSELVAEETTPVTLNGGTQDAEFTVRAFVLPRRTELSEEAAREVKLQNDLQGVYVYRENRLINARSWLGMWQLEPHFTLLRVEFSFDHRLDKAFHIDIKKSRILLNEDLFDYLKEQFLPAPRRAAEEKYRTGRKSKVRDVSESAHHESNVSIAAMAEELDTSKVEIVDEARGEVRVTNPQGVTPSRIAIAKADKPNECYVQPVASIDDGMLWQPALIDQKKGVQINTNHPYYEKVYVPNINSSAVIQSIDSLLWALCAAELSNINQATKSHFLDMRYEVSRLLRRLVEDMPEPMLETNDAE